jgi:hypothetical protein
MHQTHCLDSNWLTFRLCLSPPSATRQTYPPSASSTQCAIKEPWPIVIVSHECILIDRIDETNHDNSP